jgi:hypothetical protein
LSSTETDLEGEVLDLLHKIHEFIKEKSEPVAIADPYVDGFLTG